MLFICLSRGLLFKGILAEGKAEGKAEGETKKAIEIAKNLLSQKVDISTISTATGLHTAEIEKLKS